MRQDIFNQCSGTIIALALTTKPQRAGFPLTFELRAKGLPKKAWVKFSQIRTLSTERIGRKIGRVTADELNEIIEGLIEIIGG